MQRFARLLRSLPTLALLACMGLAQAQSEKLLPLEVTVNGSPGGTWPILERGGSLYAPSDAIQEWRLQVQGDAPAVVYRGKPYIALSAIPGYAAKVDLSSQSVQLAFSSQAFAATRLARTLASKPVLDPVLPSAFFNYDINLSTLRTPEGGFSRDLGMVGELGASTSLGVLTNSVAGRNLTANSTDGTRHWVRLESTFTRDFPDSNRTLRIGDTSTRIGLLGRNVFYGGVQFGTNFALTPGYVTQPLPVLAGVSSAASTVELYINDVLRQVSNVPPGPFALDNFPILTGSGEARLVVRDILGRETVISQPFFSSVQLLSQGLDDWSFEAGKQRLDLGTASNRYGDAFASGLWRHGLTSRVTLEGRAMVSRRLQNAGGGVVSALPLEWLGRAAWTQSSHTDLKSGHEWLLGAERQWLRGNVGVQAQGATRNFRGLGDGDKTLPLKSQVAGNATYATEYGTFGVGFAHSQRYDEAPLRTVSLNWSINLPGHSQLNLTASRASGATSGTAVGATLLIPLDPRTVITSVVQSRSGRTDFYTAANRTADGNEGLGWRALGGTQDGRLRAEAGAYYLTNHGKVTADVSASPDQQAVRLGATGGVVATSGRVFFTRRVDESFALVEVAGYGGIGVGLGNNVQALTGGDGIALVPRLLPYQNNAVRLNASDLPISAEIDSIEQIAVPRLRSAVRVKFPVRSGRGALLKIVFGDGEPAPPGAVVRIKGDTQDFYVARRGEAFITGLQPRNTVELAWKGKSCRFDVVLPPEDPNQIPRLGPIQCEGVTR
jgi:outer membrane usher protein